MLVTLRVKKYNSAFTCPKALCVIKELLCLFVFFLLKHQGLLHTKMHLISNLYQNCEFGFFN